MQLHHFAPCLLFLSACAADPEPVVSELEATQFQAEGDTYGISRGDAFRKDGDRWVFAQNVYDPDFYAKNYEEEDGRVFLKNPEGERVEVKPTFKSGFEDAPTLKDLIGLKPGWTGLTLQSPKAKTVSDYVKLRHRILSEGAPFLDNLVEPSEVHAHSGKRSLRTLSVAKSSDMVCCKSSIQSELIHFKKGDDFWFSGWFWFESGMPFSIMDLESTWITGHAGIRIDFNSRGPWVELKWGNKPAFRTEKPVAVPAKAWVRYVVHFKLSEGPDGVIELWQDGVKVVDAKGQTLPLADTVYNSLEVGISSNHEACEMFVDDVEVSDKDLR